MKFKYFTYREFDCKGGEGKGENMNDDFVCLLDEARELAGIPFKITSGYRTEEYNKRLMDYGFQASITSSHLKGLAADIEVKSSEDRFRIIGALVSVGIYRIGIGKDFIHCDIDENKKPNLIWTYY